MQAQLKTVPLSVLLGVVMSLPFGFFAGMFAKSIPGGFLLAACLFGFLGLVIGLQEGPPDAEIKAILSEALSRDRDLTLKEVWEREAPLRAEKERKRLEEEKEAAERARAKAIADREERMIAAVKLAANRTTKDREGLAATIAAQLVNDFADFSLLTDMLNGESSDFAAMAAAFAAKKFPEYWQAYGANLGLAQEDDRLKLPANALLAAYLPEPPRFVVNRAHLPPDVRESVRISYRYDGPPDSPHLGAAIVASPKDAIDVIIPVVSVNSAG